MASSVTEKFEDALNRPRTLESSGDPEHDAMTDQVLGLDALHPLRDADKMAAYDEVVADSEEEK